MKNSKVAASPTWQSRAEAADRLLEEGDYELALSCYRAALGSLGTTLEIAKDQVVSYLSDKDGGAEEWQSCLVIDIHQDKNGGEPYYTIQLLEDDEDGEKGAGTKEKQTTADRLAVSFAKEKQLVLAKMVECHLNLPSTDESKAAALEQAKKCVALDQDWDQGHFLLARAYLVSSSAGVGSSGSSLEACNELDRCLTLNPEHEAAKKLLAEQWQNALPKLAEDKEVSSFKRLGTWQANKEAAERLYVEGKYNLSLKYYQEAVSPSFEARPTLETQAILCGMVDCHLKLGGTEHEKSAVDEAKKCVAISKKYGKGHLCLAKAYLALDKDEHQEKAVKELEMCLRFNPKCTEAQRLWICLVRGDKAKRSPPVVEKNNEESAVVQQAHNEKDHQGVFRRCLIDLAVSSGLDGLYRDGLAIFRRQPSEIQFLVKIVMLLLAIRMVGVVLQFLGQLFSWIFNAGVVPAISRVATPDVAGGGLITMLVIGGIAYVCHKNNINPFLALMALNMADGNRRGNNWDMFRGAALYEMVRDRDRPPHDRVHHHGDPFYRPYPYRWYHWHYWW